MARAARIAACCLDAPLGVNAALPLLTRLKEAMTHAEAARDPSDAASLHALRIALKRLRYTLEILADVVPGSEEFLRTLRTLQDELGVIHDADVLAPIILADMGHGGESPGLRALLERTRQERDEAFRRFSAVWGPREQADFEARLRQAALDAGRPSGAESLTPSLANVPAPLQAAVADSVALLRLVPCCPRLRRAPVKALSRAVSRLAKEVRTDGSRVKVEAISRCNRRLARALARASR